MLTHEESAESYLSSAEHRNADESQHYSNLAIAHYLAALLDYLQQDDDATAEQRETDRRATEVIAQQAEYIQTLESELEATRAALRVREEAVTIEMQAMTWRAPEDIAAAAKPTAATVNAEGASKAHSQWGAGVGEDGQKEIDADQP